MAKIWGIAALVIIIINAVVFVFGSGVLDLYIYPLFIAYHRGLAVALTVAIAVCLVGFIITATNSRAVKVIASAVAVIGTCGFSLYVMLAVIFVTINGSSRMQVQGETVHAVSISVNWIDTITDRLLVMRCNGLICSLYHNAQAQKEDVFVRRNEQTNTVEIGAGGIVYTVMDVDPTPFALPETRLITPENITDVESLVALPRGYVSQLAWEPDGSAFAIMAPSVTSGTGVDNRSGAYVYRLENLSEPERLISQDIGRYLAYSSDGQYIAMHQRDRDNNQWVSIWDTNNGEQVGTLADAGVSFTPIEILFHGDYLGYLQGQSGFTLARFENGSVTDAGAFSYTDTERGVYEIAAVGDEYILSRWEDIIIWNPETDETRQLYDMGASYLALNGDGTQMVIGVSQTGVFIVDTETGETLHTLIEGNIGINALAFHPTEPLVFTGGFDGVITMWSSEDGSQLTQLEGHADDINSIVVNPSGTLIATTSSDGTIRLWGVR